MEKMIKAMSSKVAEVLAKRVAIEEYLDSMELTAGQHKQALQELYKELASHTEAMTMADDLGQAGLIRQQIKATEEQIELVKMVNENKVNTMKKTLADKADAFFGCHAEAVTEFKELDKEMIAITSLRQLKEQTEMMRGIANTLNNSLSDVKLVLIDEGIITQADKFYAGYHLNQRELMSELSNFEFKVNPYIRELTAKGVSL